MKVFEYITMTPEVFPGDRVEKVTVMFDSLSFTGISGDLEHHFTESLKPFLPSHLEGTELRSATGRTIGRMVNVRVLSDRWESDFEPIGFQANFEGATWHDTLPPAEGVPGDGYARQGDEADEPVYV